MERMNGERGLDGMAGWDVPPPAAIPGMFWAYNGKSPCPRTLACQEEERKEMKGEERKKKKKKKTTTMMMIMIRKRKRREHGSGPGVSFR